MKINELKRRTQLIDESVIDGISGDYSKFKELDQLDSGYAQLARLANVFKTGDWGALIDNTGRLNMQDISKIKVQLNDLIFNNPLIVGYETGASSDGDEKLRLLGNGIATGVELALSAAITAVFGALTISSAASGVLSWLTGIEALATVGTAGLTARQVGFLQDIKAAWELLNIIDAYDSIGSYGTVKRGIFRQFLDWIEGKSPQQIQREMQIKARIASFQAKQKFDTLVSRLPQYVTYYDDNNEPREYPTVKLFEMP